MTCFDAIAAPPGPAKDGTAAVLPAPRTSGPAIALDTTGGDAWAWEKTISGECVGCPAEATIMLEVGDRVFPVQRDGEAFAGTVRFAPGRNEVTAVAVLPDGTGVVSLPATYDVNLRPRPVARLTVRIEDCRLFFDASGSSPSDYDGSPVVAWTVEARASNPAPFALEPVGPGVFSADLPVADGAYFADLLVADEAGRSDRAAARFVVMNGEARVPDPVHGRAEWIAPAVVYGVVPRNFDPPGFAGVAARLDDLRDLGVSALWFSPITGTPDGDFGYAVTDYFGVNPAHGTLDEFRALVDAAHARGLRVLMDVVPNHTSARHPYAADAEANGEASAYWDYYDRDQSGEPTHYFDWRHLPNLNYDNPEVRRFMLEALAFWVRDVGVDGFRVDAIWGILQRRPEWLAEFLAEIYRIEPDALIVAEASARDGAYFDLGFDAAYDWTDELGQWAWRDVFGGDSPVGERLLDALTDGGKGYRPDALVMRFLNNNDTGPRFLTAHGVGCYRAALAILLTLPGLPCLYTGDEVGAEFEPYRTPGPIDWTDHDGLRPYLKTLIAARRDYPALHSRSWRPVVVDPDAPLVAYLRFDDTRTASPVLVIVNTTAADVEATVSLAAAGRALWNVDTLVDLLGGEDVPLPAGETLVLTVPAWSAKVMTDVRA